MPLLRRPAAVTAVVATALSLGAAALGVATTSAAAPGVTTPPAATTAAVAGNPKVPGATPCCGYAFLRPGQSVRSDNPAGAVLRSGGLAGGGSGSLTTYSPYQLVLQADGNLVEYREDAHGRTAVWATGTRSATPTVLRFQADGNVVLRDRAGTALWSTGTSGRPAVWFDAYGNGQVVTQDSTGHVLSSHGPAEVTAPGMAVSWAVSPAFVTGSSYRSLTPQTDGNLVEYVEGSDTRRAVWSTNTAGAGPVRLTAQSDGNLVLRQISTERAVWASGSHGPTAFYQLDVQDDGNLVLYRTDGIRRVQAVWSTGIRR